MRHSRDEIITVLPQSGLEKAEQLVHDFARALEKKSFPTVQALMRNEMEDGDQFEIFVNAGITEGTTSDDIDQLIEKAGFNKKRIAKYRCGKECNSK